MKTKKNKSDILQKKAELETVSKELKKKFIGIDTVIDQFIKSIESWYLYPEFRNRPLIVNIWGVTGVGKTALVREFVKLIKFEKQYCELEAASTDAYLLKDTLYDSNINSDDKAIVFIDEFQKLKTVNEKSEEMENNDVLIDLWSFLSDGTFPIEYNLRARLETIIHDLENSKYTKTKKIDVYDSDRIKTNLKGKVKSMPNFTSMTKERCITVLKEIVDKSETYENKVFKNLLIIIGGNLDEAFTFSGDVYDSDTDADIYNEMSSEIKLSNIKKALLKRFRPEQIARLGNIHIIYPVLSKSAYYELIKKTTSEYINKFEDCYEINITVDDSIYDAIYKNGVFPTQGVRPVFGTVSIFVESPVSSIIGDILLNDKESSKIKDLSFYYEDNSIKCKCHDNMYLYKIEETLNSISDKETDNELTLFSVHEAGHAVMQAILFGKAPRQLVAKSSTPGIGGFCSVYQNTGSKNQIRKNIMCDLGGRIAEKLVFGDNMFTYGASFDLLSATQDLMDYNNAYGMNYVQSVWTDYANGSRGRDDTDRKLEVESLMNELYKEATDIMNNNKGFLIKVSDLLIKNKSVTTEEFIEIGKEFGYTLDFIKYNQKIEEDFSKKYEEFKYINEKMS